MKLFLKHTPPEFFLEITWLGASDREGKSGSGSEMKCLIQCPEFFSQFARVP
jgi:hypothetical protein